MQVSFQPNSESQSFSSQTMNTSNPVNNSDFNGQSIVLTSPCIDTSKASDSSSEDWREFSRDSLSKKRPLPDDFESSISNEDSGLINLLDTDDILNRKPGRKPMEEEFFDDDEDPKIKRKAQNRAAQRAFRERKERYVKELEKKIKLVQDSHMFATAQLFQENEQLKSVIYRLELENYALKGISVDMINISEIPVKLAPSNQSWLSTTTQQPSFSNLPTLAPLQIRPSPTAASSPSVSHRVPILPQQKKAKTDLKSECSVKKSSTSVPADKAQNTDSNQQFTFSISTPDTLRASVNNNNPQNTEKIQMVQLYPDHSHPANQHFETKSKQPKSVGTATPILSPTIISSPVSVASSRSDSCSITYEVDSSNKKDESYGSSLDSLLFAHSTEEDKLGALLEPLFDTSEEFDINTLI